MSLGEIKQGNKTVAMFSLFVVILLVATIGRFFGILGDRYEVFTPLGTGILVLVGAIALFTETYFEGRKAKPLKNYMDGINTLFSVALAVFGAILIAGRPEIVGAWKGVLGVSLIAVALLLAKELFFD